MSFNRIINPSSLDGNSNARSFVLSSAAISLSVADNAAKLTRAAFSSPTFTVTANGTIAQTAYHNIAAIKYNTTVLTMYVPLILVSYNVETFFPDVFTDILYHIQGKMKSFFAILIKIPYFYR